MQNGSLGVHLSAQEHAASGIRTSAAAESGYDGSMDAQGALRPVAVRPNNHRFFDVAPKTVDPSRVGVQAYNQVSPFSSRTMAESIKAYAAGLPNLQQQAAGSFLHRCVPCMVTAL